MYVTYVKYIQVYWTVGAFRPFSLSHSVGGQQSECVTAVTDREYLGFIKLINEAMTAMGL